MWPSSYIKPYSIQVGLLLVVAYFSNDSSFTTRLTSNLYEITTAKLANVVLNLLITSVPATEMFLSKNFGQL